MLLIRDGTWGIELLYTAPIVVAVEGRPADSCVSLSVWAYLQRSASPCSHIAPSHICVSRVSASLRICFRR